MSFTISSASSLLITWLYAGICAAMMGHVSAFSIPAGRAFPNIIGGSSTNSIMQHNPRRPEQKLKAVTHDNDYSNKKSRLKIHHYGRRTIVLQSLTLAQLATIKPANAKCTDIESCREEGERKIQKDLAENPVTTLSSGARYKVLQPGTGSDTAKVQADSNVDVIFSVSTLSGGYMYSKGFGYEKVDLGNGNKVPDTGLDSLRIVMGKSPRDVPLGIEDALVGMKKGERRRVELPPRVGFETSNWRPEPETKRGKAGMVGYRRILEGNGSNQPPFPAATIWDIEVLRIR